MVHRSDFDENATPTRPLPLQGGGWGTEYTVEGEIVAEEPDLLDLEEVREGDLPLVGAKALNLGLMAQVGLPVPRGFVITTNAFKKSTRSPSGRIQIPGSLKQRIIAAYQERGLHQVAVRSSATLEDLPQASFAGIYLSRPNVSSEAELLTAIEECFHSLRTLASDVYRRNMGLDGDQETLGMAVVVQEMIDAEVSGVMYTLNPITLDREELFINAVFGLSEPLVSGRVPGDVFRVDRRGCLPEQRLSEKASMLTLKGETPVPKGRRNLPTLTPLQLAALVEQGLAIEAHFGGPQDIEFAFADGKLHIVQSRPITIGHEPLELKIERYRRKEIEKVRSRITDLRQEGKLEGSEAVYSHGNIGEILPTPTPMSFGIFTCIFAEEGGIRRGRRHLGYDLDDKTSEGLFELICGHPYFNLEIDAATFHVGFPLEIQGYIDKVKANPQLANYPELGLYEQHLTLDEAVARFGQKEGRRYHALFLEFLVGMTEWAEGYLDRFSSEVEPALQRYLEQERDQDPALVSAEEIAEEIHSSLEHLRTMTCVHFVIAARLGFFFTERFRSKMMEFFPKEGEGLVTDLLRGLEGSKIGQQAKDLAKLVQREMSQGEFLKAYGHLATNELEISLPRIADDPHVLEEMVKEFKKGARDPFKGAMEQARKRRKDEEEVRARLEKEGINPFAIQELFRDLTYAQRYLPLRETIKYYLTAEYALIRRALLALAEKLGLPQDDIFYLSPRELPELFSSFETVKGSIQQRKEERRFALHLSTHKRMPHVIFESALEEIGQKPIVETLQQFQGSPVSSGEAVGTVKIIDPEELDLARGLEEVTEDVVIVARAANLGLFPIIRNAAGLILETGGILAHGACLARESGIPAVVLERATVLLPEGIRVRIDGHSGKVDLLA
ncbi:MAG: hypothetical protein HY347_01825 [candidate division NC10 bacterium]|nr:hypothetical protein [candidate division NC10 bacterium]